MSITVNATVKNPRGIHARPSSEIARASLKYKSDITIKCDDRTANSKDVLQLIMLELFEGSRVTIEVSGDDEADASKEIKTLIEKEYHFD
jgi:phosphotransferase system HPr (HPr) family protein